MAKYLEKNLDITKPSYSEQRALRYIKFHYKTDTALKWIY